MENKVASALDVNLDEAAMLPDLVTTHVFFAKLAEFGVVPQTEDEAQVLLALGGELAQDERLDQAKVAASPEERASLVAEVQTKTAAFMEDPAIFAAVLALVHEAKLAD